MGLKEMRDELRELRKSSGQRPISRMKKSDIASEIERLKVHREETPAPAAVPSAPLKKSVAAVENIKEAKRSQFPVKPEDAKPKKSAPVKGEAVEKKKGVSKKDMLAKLMAMMESDTDE